MVDELGAPLLPRCSTFATFSKEAKSFFAVFGPNFENFAIFLWKTAQKAGSLPLGGPEIGLTESRFSKICHNGPNMTQMGQGNTLGSFGGRQTPWEGARGKEKLENSRKTPEKTLSPQTAPQSPCGVPNLVKS